MIDPLRGPLLCVEDVKTQTDEEAFQLKLFFTRFFKTLKCRLKCPLRSFDAMTHLSHFHVSALNWNMSASSVSWRALCTESSYCVSVSTRLFGFRGH